MRGELQIAIMRQLKNHEQLSAQDLVGMTGSYLSTVRESLTRMHQRGLLAKTPIDGRSSMYSLSDKGKNTVIAEKL
jgi:DNA-binding transcriptional regulator PaaX